MGEIGRFNFNKKYLQMEDKIINRGINLFPILFVVHKGWLSEIIFPRVRSFQINISEMDNVNKMLKG